MNERIRQLAKEAGIHFHKGGTLDAGPNGIAKFVLYSDMEKFAELIVAECADIANKQFSVATGLDDRDCWTAAEMKKHFGVAE